MDTFNPEHPEPYVNLHVLPALTPEQQHYFDKYTSVEGYGDADEWYVVLNVGVQHFRVGSSSRPKNEADWMRCMLAKALSNIERPASEIERLRGAGNMLLTEIQIRDEALAQIRAKVEELLARLPD